MKTIPFNDKTGMLIAINTFKQVSIDIYENYYKKGKYGYIDAMLVNAAFSIEVGLKFLVGYDEGEYEKGHLWIYYWNKLNIRYKNCIIIFLVDRCGNKDYTTDFIEKSIERLSNTFKYLRYAFEKSSTQSEPKIIMELMYAISYVAKCRDACNGMDDEGFEAYTLIQMQKEDYVEIQF